jgi:hypothetical protein
MVRKHKPAEIIGKLREAEIVLAQGRTVADACCRIAVCGPACKRDPVSGMIGVDVMGWTAPAPR